MPSAFQQSVIDEFRANAGRVGGPFAGSDLLLLTTTGARTGRPHTTPLGHVRDGERLLVVGSDLGAPHHPDWYHNLLAHPSVHVELGDQEFETIAVPAEGSRRDELFARVVAEAPGYAEYQAATDRTLPVVVLELPGPRAPAPAVTSLADKLTEVHTWLRGQLAQVHAETEAHFAARAVALRGTGTPPPPGLGLQIRQRCLAFCQALEFHHTAEDGHMFPAMEGYHPHLRPVFERLREEHRSIAAVQSALAALLAGVAVAEPDDFRAELARMTEQLTAHLAYEEAEILPLLADVPWPPTP
ncbi:MULTISPECIES: nitroreductase/quinone reductase family protein [Streptomyces]|uniref:nitroreductase/quinone reductase family protein n=1 Tax=Streptomyces TaxID=1883 RepID=UPI000DC655F7|nr:MULTISPECIES: nitroreductase/quinone reductase family protein [Streptomyces]NUW18798.1 nitroreductase family deazaflavin-dependent oxidoreductase [Streptomyces roseoviolaceus]ATY99581.1 nitroreductase family deazaflavin-dependent oxidoreductase [Streptomyces cavourensis]NUV38921.1 nitroreductase family deazaflavin-dependent oxidoreductase [Streptomyces sp. CAI-24]NUV84811.1 nitroreductase family deazaflavin-dependent oxidoreductase [Streptomyces sp. KAI-26]TQO34491.1 deazaflavin-dependent o